MPADKLPIGIQDFDKLIASNCIYVDKTQYLYNIISAGSPAFLSRPRRFGKSLTISTLEAIFKNKRELFKGLWIDQSDWDWQEYPVIRLDMSTINRDSAAILKKSLICLMQEIAADHNLTLTGLSPADYLRNLIKQLAQHNKVVVLVDEYDKPIIDNLKNITIASEIRDILKDFYNVLKSEDAHLKFIFLTGVTKFAKVSVFSGLNNLDDLTMTNHYASVVGYTEKEMAKYFIDEIKILAEQTNSNLTACQQKIKKWYNGYQFSEAGEKVYNPFSVLRLLKYQQFKPHWFTTATPTFLLDLINAREFDLTNLEHLESKASNFESFEINNIPTVPLLYQTGYLSVKEYDPDLGTYTLGYPNYEVNSAFNDSLLSYFANSDSESASLAIELAKNLRAENWDQTKSILPNVH